MTQTLTRSGPQAYALLVVVGQRRIVLALPALGQQSWRRKVLLVAVAEESKFFDEFAMEEFKK